MKIALSHGKGELELTLPDDREVEVLRARGQAVLGDAAEATRQALAEPIDSAPLAEIARGRTSACVVISDITRPVPNREILPPILEAIESAGVAREAITILVATGIHRPNEGEELIELVGAEIADAYRCVNHYSERPGECEPIGETASGIPVHVNKIYLEADLKILTGLIEPHFWAGYSGGAKAILPGITSVETMRLMHGAPMIDACMANCGVIEGNIFRKAGLEVAEMAGWDFIVNVTVDERKRMTGVFAGHVDSAHRAGAKFCEQATAFELERPADLVIVSGGGYPLDKTFYQATKGITVAWMALREGGQTLMVTECSEGLGSPPFVELLDMVDSPEGLLELIGDPEFFKVDQWCAQVLARIQQENKVAVCANGVQDEALRRYGYEPVADAQAWLDTKLAELGPEARILVVPNGPYVFARTAAAAAMAD